VYFTIKPQEGIVATSFKPGDKVFIGGDKLLPLEKYVLPLPAFHLCD
jgi:rRNA processing protein Gar1